MIKEYIYKSHRIRASAIQRSSKWHPQLVLAGSVQAIGDRTEFDSEEEAVAYACAHGEFLVDHPAQTLMPANTLWIHAYQNPLFERGVFRVDKVERGERRPVGSMKIEEFRRYIGTEHVLNMTVDEAVATLERTSKVMVQIEA